MKYQSTKRVARTFSEMSATRTLSIFFIICQRLPFTFSSVWKSKLSWLTINDGIPIKARVPSLLCKLTHKYRVFEVSAYSLTLAARQSLIHSSNIFLNLTFCLYKHTMLPSTKFSTERIMIKLRSISILDLDGVQRKLQKGALYDQRQTPRREMKPHALPMQLHTII